MSKPFEVITGENGWSVEFAPEDIPALTEVADQAAQLDPYSRYVMLPIKIPDGYRLWKSGEADDPLKLEADGTSYTWKALNVHLDNDIVITKTEPRIKVTVEVDGEQVKPSEISAETWKRLRNG